MKSFDTDKTDNGEGKPLCISMYFYMNFRFIKERN